MWRTVGQDKAIHILKRGLARGRFPHAYLLSGAPHVGKMTLAIDLAQALNCLQDDKPCGECSQCRRIARGLHADVNVVAVDAGELGEGRGRVAISIDQVRDVQRQASLKPFEGRHRVFVFDGAEHLSEEAANSLLKTLEEPPDQVVLLLLTSDDGALLPTLVSRCQLLKLRPVSRSLIVRELETRHGVDREKADEVARLSRGRPGWAIDAVSRPGALEQLNKTFGAIEGVISGGMEARFSYAADLAASFGRNRDSVRQELALWLEWWRDVMLAKEGDPGIVTHLSRLGALQPLADALSTAQVARAINAVREAEEQLDRNVNPRLALEAMVLALPRR